MFSRKLSRKIKRMIVVLMAICSIKAKCLVPNDAWGAHAVPANHVFHGGSALVAMVDNFSGLPLLGARGENRPFRVLFFNTSEFAFAGGLSLIRYPYVTPSPLGRGLLIAVKSGTSNLPLTRIMEYSDASGAKIVRTLIVKGWHGAPMTGGTPSWFFKTGPDGVLWLLEGDRICGVRWPTLVRVCSHRFSRELGAPFIYPISGGLILSDMLPTRNPEASAKAVPKMFFLGENGKLSRLAVPHSFRGIPFFAAAVGRTLFGITDFSGDFFSLEVGRDGTSVQADESKVAPGIEAFHLINGHEGAALHAKSGRPGRSIIYFIALKTGQIIREVTVKFSAVDFAVASENIFLIGSDGRIVKVGRKGQIIRRSPIPISISGVVGPSK